MQIQLQQFQELDNLEVIAREVVEGFITGLHKSPYHGFSVEFAEHRLYNSGEAIKHIDWKLFAKTDKLFVKRFEEETNLRTHILIDTSSSMLFPYKQRNMSKLAFAGLSAAALIYLLRKQRDGVGLSFFSNELELHTSAKLSSTHAKRLYAELSNLVYDENRLLKKVSAAPAIFHQVSEQIHTRSLVVIFSDLNEWMNKDSAEEFYSSLQHFRYNKHEVVIFNLTDHKKEKDLAYQNRPTRFIDMETGEEIRLNPNLIRKQYSKLANNYFDEIKLQCARYEIDFVDVDVESDFRQVLINYLIKRSKLF